MKRLVITFTAMLMASCAGLPRPLPVTASMETTAADGGEAPGRPAIWTGGLARNQSGLAGAAFVAATTPTGGLVVHDLEGGLLSQVAGRGPAEIDIAGLPLETSYTVLIGGTERRAGRTRLSFFRLDQGEGQTPRLWGGIDTDLSTPRGFCMRQFRGVLQAAAIDRRGEVRLLTLAEGPDGQLAAQESGRFRIRDAGAGCAIDPVSGNLYISHARRGFWLYDPAPGGGGEPRWLDATGPRRLPRSHDVAFLNDRRGRYLVSLDEDGRAFSVWSIQSDGVTWRGRIEVRDQSDGRAARIHDGVDAYGGALGAFPAGLVVVHDRTDPAGPNLKYVDWAAVKVALGF